MAAAAERSDLAVRSNDSIKKQYDFYRNFFQMHQGLYQNYFSGMKVPEEIATTPVGSPAGSPVGVGIGLPAPGSSPGALIDFGSPKATSSPISTAKEGVCALHLQFSLIIGE